MKFKYNLLILVITFFGTIFSIYADTNGIWTYAKDIRGGTFGDDEKDHTTNFTFINPLFIKKNEGSLKLVGDDHTYIEYYPQGLNNGRKGLIGFGKANDDYLRLNSTGAILFESNISKYYLNSINPNNEIATKGWHNSVDLDLNPNNEIQSVIPNQGLRKDVSNNFGLITCGSSQILKYNGVNWVCSADLGITTETDPQVSTLTDGKWCRTDGNSVICDQNSPSGTFVLKTGDTMSGTLYINDLGNAGTKTLQIGDDSYFTDVDTVNTIGIYGNQNPDRATIRLGSDNSYISGDNGNIGIGKTNPSSKLDVAGTIKQNGYTVCDSSNNCGYPTTRASVVRVEGTYVKSRYRQGVEAYAYCPSGYEIINCVVLYSETSYGTYQTFMTSYYDGAVSVVGSMIFSQNKCNNYIYAIDSGWANRYWKSLAICIKP